MNWKENSRNTRKKIKSQKKNKKGLKLTGFPSLCDIWTHKEVSYI